MSAAPESVAEPLPDGNEVFRAVKPSWVAAGQLLPIAFIRGPRDIDGLSVTGDKDRAGSTYQRQRGIASLLTAGVRSLDLSLNVGADSTEWDAQHALITGLPFPYPDPYSEDPIERVRAHQYAERLLSIATYAV
jgi:hypothetical protein